MAMLGDHDTTVLQVKAVHALRESVLHVRKGHLLSSRHSHKYSYYRELAVSRAVPRLSDVPACVVITCTMDYVDIQTYTRKIRAAARSLRLWRSSAPHAGRGCPPPRGLWRGAGSAWRNPLRALWRG